MNVPNVALYPFSRGAWKIDANFGRVILLRGGAFSEAVPKPLLRLG